MITFTLRGVVHHDTTGLGIPGLWVKATDSGNAFDTVLQAAPTGPDGEFEIASPFTDFTSFVAGQPSIVLKVYAPDRTTLLYTSSTVSWATAWHDAFDLSLSSAVLGTYAPVQQLSLYGATAGRSTYDPGEPLTIAATGLHASTVYTIVVRHNSSELFTNRMITNTRGEFVPTVVWPQMGLDDPGSTTMHTVASARTTWGGATLTVEIRDAGGIVMSDTLTLGTSFTQPLVLSTDASGAILNGLQVGTGAATVSVYTYPTSAARAVRVYMVPRQFDWKVGDPIRPATLANGSAAVADTTLTGTQTDFTVTLATASNLPVGSFDFIVRPRPYGYEDDDMRLHATDIISSRYVAGLVVREDFMGSKAVEGGCVNKMEIAGRKLLGAPYMQYTNVFQLGEDVYAALDPTALDPNQIGKMVALYLIESKTPQQWLMGTGLTHIAQLGGNPAVPKFLTQAFCINVNQVLIWPKASQLGNYDIVADFGNDQADAKLFANDDSYDTPKDIIDGYFVPGFRVVADPTTDTSYAHSGNFSYDLNSQGSLNVVDDGGQLFTVPLNASIHFPADAGGAVMPGQISGREPSYPMVFVVHGNSNDPNSYMGYEYLLEHLAKNGFIAASIHLEPGQYVTGRVKVLFKHIDIIRGMFNAQAANNIGIMGHSRGGEAVVVAAQLNQTQVLGYGINAVISLAPTSWILNPTLGGAWAKPYLVIYGSMDGDVSGITDTGFELYDRANGDKKSMIFVYGSTHGRYNTVWGDADTGTLGPADKATLINADAHQKIAKGYMTAFFRQYLQGDTQWEGMFKGEWVPAEVQAADGGKVKLYTQYGDTVHREIDTFEGAHAGGDWATSTIGGAVTPVGLPANPVEAEAYPTDLHAPHDTGVLFVQWDTQGDTLTFDIPNGQRDVHAFNVLSFRIGQKVGSMLNPAGLPQDLRVTLHDTFGHSRAIRVSKFAEIPPPHERSNAFLTKSAMNTVRIPLSSYTIRCAGLVEVDLTTVDSITFEFSEIATGEVLIDSVEFSN